MKVAFFCNYNKKSPEKIQNLEEGNIGLGGTQYLFMLVVSNLQKQFNNEKENYILLTNQQINIDSNILQYSQVKDIKEAYKWCNNNYYDYLVIRENDINLFSEKEIRESKTSFILWAHNYIGKNTENLLYRQKKIAKLICVSRQQYINMRNSLAYKKMTYINNCLGRYIDDKNLDETLKKGNHIYYIGAIEPSKGVHNVIKIFKSVNKKNKNSKLVIIGGMGNLRAKDTKTGTMQLTYPNYENKLLNMIKSNKLEKKVEFTGILNSNEIKEKVKENPGIGLVSISRPFIGETFCMTALELESYGIPVVSRRRYDGLETSVKRFTTGFLEITDRKLVKRILEIEQDNDLYIQMARNSIEHAKNFSITKIVYEWQKLFFNIDIQPEEYKETAIYKIKNNIKINFITTRELVVRLQTKILLKIYRKWMR